MKRTGLGRGLDALMPEMPAPQPQQAEPGDRVELLDIGDVDPNPNQPRRHFDQAALKELSDSIKNVGILQPILVCEMNGRYRIIAGERRWRAARLAELTEIPAIVRQMDVIERMEAALVENLQREDLNPIEEATAVRALMEECGLTQEAAAERLGRSRPALANLLRLLSLPESVKTLVETGALSAGHARVLAGLDDQALIERLAAQAVAEGWSVRQMELNAQLEAAPATKKNAKPKRGKPPEFTDLEEKLRFNLGMKAEISGTLERGKIILKYNSRQELERLYDAMEED